MSVIGKVEDDASSKVSGVSHRRYCVEKMHGVSIGIDCLTRYSDRVRDDPCALNLWAILLERQNLLRSARTALQSAQTILEENIADQKYDSVHLNLGR